MKKYLLLECWLIWTWRNWRFGWFERVFRDFKCEMRKWGDVRWCMTLSCDLTHVGCIERDLSHIGCIPTWIKSCWVCLRDLSHVEGIFKSSVESEKISCEKCKFPSLFRVFSIFIGSKVFSLTHDIN